MATVKRKANAEALYPTQSKKTPSVSRTRKNKGRVPKDSSAHVPELDLTGVVREPPESTTQEAETKETSLTPDTAETRYFLQVEKGNLLTCFITGLIYPAYLDTQQNGKPIQRTPDLQSKVPEKLLLTQAFTDDADDNQVLAEIVLSPAELSSLESIGDAFLISVPLPVSRVVSIWAKSQTTIESLLSSAKLYSDNPFPVSLLRAISPEFPLPVPAPDTSRVMKNAMQISDLQAKRALYDRIMGMLAFMRNSERYFSQRNRRYSDLASNYLATLARLNSGIRPLDATAENAKAADFYLELLSGHPRDAFFASLLEVIVKGGVFDKETVRDIVVNHCACHDEQTIKTARAAFDGLFDDNFKLCIQQLLANAKLWNLTVLAVLYRFRKKDGDDKIAVKQIFPGVIADQKKAEIILAFLGMYYGYTSLPKNEEISSLDLELATFIGPLHPIKFDIKSPLDRNVVETAYRFTFQDTKATAGFDYLPKETARKEHGESVAPSSKRFRFKTWTLMGVPIRIVEVVDAVGSLINLIRETYPKGRSTGYLAFFAATRWPMAIIRFGFTREKGLDIDVDTEEVIRSLSALKPVDLDEAKSCVELDRSLSSMGSRG